MHKHIRSDPLFVPSYFQAIVPTRTVLRDKDARRLRLAEKVKEKRLDTKTTYGGVYKHDNVVRVTKRSRRATGSRCNGRAMSSLAYEKMNDEKSTRHGMDDAVVLKSVGTSRASDTEKREKDSEKNRKTARARDDKKIKREVPAEV